jgi:TolB-like protein/DNA-binding winged helix-turn-helix (wHTH) protein/Tfp pilus assembly protein PilF
MGQTSPVITLPTIQFGDYDLDCVRCELRRAGRLIRLQRLPCELLQLLIERRGFVVTRAEISQRLWTAGVHVDIEHNINTAIRKVRHALRDDAGRQRYIQTVVGKGYRFIGQIIDPAAAKAPEVVAIALEEVAAEAVAPEIVLPFPSPLNIDVEAAPAVNVEVPHRTRSIIWGMAVVGAGCFLIAIIVMLYQDQLPHWASESAPAVRSLAVLPFRNLTGDVEQDFIAESLTDELTSNLGEFHSLRVVSPGSAIKVRNSRDRLAQIRHLLSVDAIVQGSESFEKGHLRIAIQLVDTRSRRYLWVHNYELIETDANAIRNRVLDEASRQISDVLHLRNRTNAERRPTPNAIAYNDYLRGRYFWNRRTLDTLQKSIGYYQEALKADPEFAQGYAALADSYVLLSSYGGPEPARSLVQARENAQRALQLDPHLGEAHAVLGAVKVDADWNWEGAEEEYRTALRLNPEYATAHHWYALHLSRLGRHAEAESQIQEALALDPLSLIINTDAGEIFYRGGQLNQALQYVNKAIELDPGFAEAYLVTGEIDERLHQALQAVNSFRTAEKLFGDAPNAVALEGHALALAGDRKQAADIARRLEALSTHRYISGVDIAMVYCALGDSDQAMTWLERAYDRRDKGLNIIAADPIFAGCRAERRFDELLARLRLPALTLQ